MPTYLTPGVYVEEIPAQSKPIEGVGTSVAAFVGLAPGGPLNTPMRISNWTQFAKIFGDPSNPDAGPFMSGAYLAHSVYGFFQNGGGLCWVVRVGGESSNGSGPPPAQAALPAAANPTVDAWRAVALPGVDGDVAIELSEEPPPPPPEGEGEGDAGGKEPEPSWRLIVTAGGEREEHEGLTLKRGRTNLATKVNAASKLIRIEETGASLPEGQRAPATGSYSLVSAAVAPTDLSGSDFEGDVARRQGLGSIAAIDEVTMVVVPDLQTLSEDVQVRDLQGKIIAHCENAGDRMAILDGPADMLPQDILEWRMDTAGYDSKFATLYYPWIEVMDPLTNQPILVPPSGHVAGVWARTDGTRGVHKAPANEVVLGANGLAFQVTHEEQGGLNTNGVNCIRAFSGRGIRIWGARTLSSDPEWRYVNVRRLFNYVSESIIEGTQWAVFEPNDHRLWTRLRISSANFLTRVWRDGALFGATPEQAFYVKCDAETNPPEAVEAGQVVIEIGIAPVKPAEFVVFRISQFTAGAAEVSA
ncbi:phage tail sheath family protein [Miltoncostaea oceani]|uniref:phage tail sheath family protein n=1 Tax=Miltoncostaea oceani TaxID=2843216 RepID=UPI001C3C9A5D|nr:phage tail sheath subtilisin-like domain-containing protein [Miltoncostaea oceani]